MNDPNYRCPAPCKGRTSNGPSPDASDSHLEKASGAATTSYYSPCGRCFNLLPAALSLNLDKVAGIPAPHKGLLRQAQDERSRKVRTMLRSRRAPHVGRYRYTPCVVSRPSLASRSFVVSLSNHKAAAATASSCPAFPSGAPAHAGAPTLLCDVCPAPVDCARTPAGKSSDSWSKVL